MKLVIADTEVTATAIAPMYVGDETTIVLFCDRIAETIKNPVD